MPFCRPTYEVYALRYATVDAAPAGELHRGRPARGATSMDYYVWAIVGEGESHRRRHGFRGRGAERRQRTCCAAPPTRCGRWAIEAHAGADVVITHLHYDHAGNLDKFPSARFHLQEAEVAFATGPCMCEPFLRHAYDVEDVVQMVRYVYDGRVRSTEAMWNCGQASRCTASAGTPTACRSCACTPSGAGSCWRPTPRTTRTTSSGAHRFPSSTTWRHAARLRPLARRWPIPTRISVPGHDPMVLRSYPAWPCRRRDRCAARQ